MGLDMFAYSVPEAPETEVDFSVDSNDQREIYYWRKHPNLHGWMEDLYWAKGGVDRDFNCAPVVLTRDDLIDLQLAIEDDKLPHTTGFFFGRSDGSEQENDLEFARKALAEVEAGRTVYYTSWW